MLPLLRTSCSLLPPLRAPRSLHCGPHAPSVADPMLPLCVADPMPPPLRASCLSPLQTPCGLGPFVPKECPKSHGLRQQGLVCSSQTPFFCLFDLIHNVHACLLCAAVQPQCKTFLDISLADPGSPSPVELGQVAAVVRTAIAAQHVKNADAFPAQRDGVIGMMKGGGLKTVGYSKHGHANEPKTFPDCLDGGCRRCCAAPSIDRRWRLARACSPTRLPACRTR